MSLAREALANYEHGVWNGVALLLFLATFIAVFAWVMRKGARDHYERASKLPLE